MVTTQNLTKKNPENVCPKMFWQRPGTCIQSNLATRFGTLATSRRPARPNLYIYIYIYIAISQINTIFLIVNTFIH